MRGIERGFRKVRNQLFKAFYGGEGCDCQYCGKSYRKLLHQGVRAEVFKKHRISGAGHMKNVRCPTWIPTVWLDTYCLDRNEDVFVGDKD